MVLTRYGEAATTSSRAGAEWGRFTDQAVPPDQTILIAKSCSCHKRVCDDRTLSIRQSVQTITRAVSAQRASA